MWSRRILSTKNSKTQIKLDGYLGWYNEGRIKVSLGGMSPVQYRMRLGLL